MLGFFELVIISDIRGENMKYWILAFYLLVSCTTANINTSYSDDLEKFIDYPENELYDVWGMPDRMFYVTSNIKVVTYLSMSNKVVNMPYGKQIYYSGINDNRWWNRLFGPPKADEPDIYYCKTSFIIKNGIVTNFNFNGDACVVK